MATTDGSNFDYIIVGGGVMGLCTAHYLAKKNSGERILLLDQFPLPNSRGSSHGHSRIYRTAYHHPVLAAMAKDAADLWRSFEKENDIHLLQNCGVLLTGVKEIIDRTESSLISSCASYEKYTYRELIRNFQCQKQLQNFPEDQIFLFDRSGGIMFAKDCMNFLLQAVIGSGVSVQNELVSAINQEKSNDFVEVLTNKRQYSCRSVIITPGAWAPRLLSKLLGIHLPLEPTLVAALYWRVKEGTGVSFRPENLPPLIDYYDKDPLRHIYSIPELEYPRCIKLSHQIGSLVDPDRRDQTKYPDHVLKEVSQYISQHLPLIDSTFPAIHEACLYTQSPDYLYVIDRVPHCRNIIIGAGFSGNGFKMGPVIGKILSSLAMGIDPGYDLSDFSLERFGRPVHAL